MAAGPFKQQLAFVSGHDREARRQARTHIMREYQRKKRWKASQEENRGVTTSKPRKGPYARDTMTAKAHDGPTCASSPSITSWAVEEGVVQTKSSSPTLMGTSSSGSMGISNSSSNLRITHPETAARYISLSDQNARLESSRRREQQSGLLDMLDSSDPDPFRTYPVEVEPDLRGEIFTQNSLDLLGYQMFGADKNARFNPMKDIIFPLCLHDPACFSGLLAMAASHKDFLYHRNARADTVKHRLSSIQQVNRRLSDPQKSIADGTIMAITTLWCLEVHYGNPETLQLHANGLQQIIASRGGFSALATSPRLEMILTWCILILPGTMSLASSALNGHAPISPADTTLSLRLCCAELVEFIYSIRVLSMNSPSPYDSESFMFAHGSPLSTLLSEPLTLRAGHYGNHHVQMLCRLAALLFLHSTYVSYAADQGSFVLLRHQLKKVRLALIEHNLDRGPSIELLLWVLLKAEETTAVGNLERTCHVSRMMSVGKRLTEESLERLCEILFAYLVRSTPQRKETDYFGNLGKLTAEVLGDTDAEADLESVS